MASCPDCGFDLSGSKRCDNCGFELPSPTSAMEGDGSSAEGSLVLGLVDVEERSLRRPIPAKESVEEAPSLVDTDPERPLLLPPPSHPVASNPIDRGPSSDRRPRGRDRKRLLVFFVAAATVTIAAGAAAHFLPGRGGATFVPAAPPAAARTLTQMQRPPESSAAPPVTHADLRLPGPHEFIDLWNPTSKASPVRSAKGAAGRAAELPPTGSEAAYVAWMRARTDESEAFLRQRWNRAQTLRRNKELTKRSVLDAFLLTPREWFCRSFNLPEAYAAIPLPIGYGQIMPSPGLSVRMIDLLNPQPGDRVLEVGTGSGYQSALLAQLVSRVYTVEIVKPLAEETNRLFERHGGEMPRLSEIRRRIGDGYYGWKKEAPFDRIIVTVSIDHIPPALIDQLKPGGIMVVPVGPPSGQRLLAITKKVGPDGRVTLDRAQAPGASVELLPMTSASGGTHNVNQ